MPVGVYNNITADSTPDLDGWGIDKYWGCQHWVKWHSLMVEKYGIKYANDTFLMEWEKQTFGASPGDCTTFNPAFIAYAKKYGFYQALFSGAAFLVYPLAVVSDVIIDAGKVIDNASNAAVNTTGLLKYLLPVAAIGLGLWAANEYIIKPMNFRKSLTKKA